MGTIESYRVIFFAYAALGFVKFLLAVALTKRVEAEKKKPEPVSETAPLLGERAPEEPPAKKPKKSILPSISKESRTIVVNLCILFALDAFASGLAPL